MRIVVLTDVHGNLPALQAALDAKGRARYINPGSLGCVPTAEARYALVEITKGQWTMTQCSIPYDDTPLLQAFEARQVPERAFLYHAFFGGRFHA